MEAKIFSTSGSAFRQSPHQDRPPVVREAYTTRKAGFDAEASEVRACAMAESDSVATWRGMFGVVRERGC